MPTRLLLCVLLSAPLLLAACAAPRAAAPSASSGAPTGSGEMPAPAMPTLATAAPAAPATAGSYQPSPLRPAVPVKVGVIGGSSDAGIYLAADKGYFRDEGLEIEIVEFSNSSDTVGAVVAGQIDVVTGAVAAGIFNAIGRGLPLRIVADKGSTPSPEWDFAVLMVRKDLVDSGRVRDYADLRGLTLARASLRGTSPETETVKALAKGGLTLDDVNSVQMAFPDMIAGFANGAIEGAIVIEPFVSRIESMGTAVRWRGNSEFYGNQQVAVIIYGPNVMGGQAEVGRRWMLGYVRALRDYNDAFGPKRQGRDQVIDVLTRYTAVKDRAAYEQMRPAGLDPDGKLVMASLYEDLAYFQDTGLVREVVDPTLLVDTSFQEYAVQRLGPYQP